MALLLAEQTDASGQSGAHQPLTRTGVRSPWMPAPLQGGAASIMRATLIVAVAAATTVGIPGAGGNFTLTGMVPRTPDLTRAPISTSIIVNQQPIPGASYLPTYPIAPRDTPAAQPDRINPVLPILGQQPIPGATSILGLALRDPDVTRPGFAATVQTPPVPIPGANYSLLNRPNLEASIQWPQVRLVAGQQPIPGASYTLIDVPNLEAPIQWPQAELLPGQMPIPGAITIPTSSPRDQEVATQDRLNPILLLSGQQPIPAAGLALGLALRDPDITRPGFAATVQTGQQPVPSSATIATYAPRDQVVVQQDRFNPILLVVGQQQIPGATSILGLALRDPDITRPGFAANIQPGQQPIPGPSVTLGTALRVPDVTRPGFAATILAGQQPIPGANYLSTYSIAPRDAPPIQWPITAIQVNQPPVPGAWLALGTALRVPDVTRPGFAASILTGQQPIPLAITIATYAPRDTVAVQPDRLNSLLLFVGAQPTPQAAALILSRPMVEAAMTWPAPRVMVGSQPTPLAVAIITQALRDEPTILARLLVQVNQPPIPGAISIVTRSILALQAPRATPVLPILNQPPIPVNVTIWIRAGLSPIVAPTAFVFGTVFGPGLLSSVQGATIGATVFSPGTTGRVDGS